MRKTNLNIPAVLVHKMKGTTYKVNGTLLSINESNDTCTMRFKGNHIESGIPMDKILINEGFLDKIKEYGQKVANYITRKVKGFLALVDETTNKVLPWSINNVGNLAIQASKGMLPEGVYFAPSPSLQRLTGVKGMTIDQAFAESEAKDREEIVKYWSRVIKRAGTTKDETIQESVKYVNEKYYKNVTVNKPLNEAIYSIDAIKNKRGFGEFGVAVSAKQLKSRLKTNIRNQLSGPLGGHADQKPYLIWGAPGIGKTAIINSVIKEMAESKYNAINLNLEVIMLAGYTIENWTLPRDNSRTVHGVTIESFTDTPKTWLPVYLNTSDPEERKRRDIFCNTCQFLATDDKDIVAENGHPFEGGIVFMDEYSRVEPNVQNVVMGICNEHKFGDNYQVASKWGFVFAANRSYDESDATSTDRRYFPTDAQKDRFVSVTYVPKRSEWLDWATSINKVTHKANVPPFITDFIAASHEFVWYSTIDNGGFDDMLNTKFADTKGQRPHEVEDGMDDAIDTILNNEILLKTKRIVTPRTWANTIGPTYRMELINIFQGNKEGLSGEEYYQKLVDESYYEKEDENGNKVKDYYGDILPAVLIDELNNVDDDYWEEWYEEKGGDEELDPTGQFNGIRRRYNIFMTWFADMMREAISDDTGTNAATAKGPVMTEWRSYQSFAKIFTPAVKRSIWETGKMPKEYQADDDITPITLAGFADTQYSKWKQVSTILYEVTDNVFTEYPGKLETDIAKDIEALQNAKRLTDAQVTKEAKKLEAEYAFKLDGKMVNLLFDEYDYANVDLLRNKVNSLLNSKVAQNYTHFASWICKVALQSKNPQLANIYEQALFDSLFDIDSDISNEFLNSVAIRKATTASNKANNKDANLLAAKRTEESKVPIAPAIAMLVRARRYDFDHARGVK